MTTRRELRPIERRIIAMSRKGLQPEEIGARLRRSPSHIRRILELIELRRSQPRKTEDPSPLERRVIALRSRGESYHRIARRFGRSPRFIRQVEGFTYVKHGRSSRAFFHGAELLRQTAAEARRYHRIRTANQEV